MPEGIIQKVIREYAEEKGCIPWDRFALEEVEQKLIKEITEQAIRPLPDMPYIYLHKLIGETKE